MEPGDQPYMRTIKKHPFIKSTAAVTIVAFFMTQLYLPNQGFAQVTPVAPLFVQPNITEVALPTKFELSLPKELGRVEEMQGGLGPTLIHIQTAHGNYEAQKKIEAILHHFKNDEGIDALFLEGTAFELNPELIRFFPDRMDLTHDVADRLTKKALLKGPELFLIDEPNVPAFGVEDLEAYKKGTNAFRAVLHAREKTEHFLATLDQQIGRLTTPYLNSDLRGFLREIEQFDSGLQSLSGWLDTLQTQAKSKLKIDFSEPIYQVDWPMLIRIFKLKKWEKSIDARLLRNERETFLKEVSALLPEDLFKAIEKLLTGGLDMTHGSSESLSNVFERMVSYLPASFDYSKHPNLDQMIGYLILQSEVRAEDLMVEVDRLENQILKALVKNRDETEILNVLKDYKLLQKLFALELTPNDHDQILRRDVIANPEGAKQSQITPSNIVSRALSLNTAKRVQNTEFSHIKEIESLFAKALEFYQVVKDRDALMIENIVSRMKELKAERVVVVTGGFHKKPFKDYFSKHNFKYALVAPNLGLPTVDWEEGNANYIKSILDTDPAQTITPPSAKLSSPHVLSGDLKSLDSRFRGNDIETPTNEFISLALSRNELRAHDYAFEPIADIVRGSLQSIAGHQLHLMGSESAAHWGIPIQTTHPELRAPVKNRNKLVSFLDGVPHGAYLDETSLFQKTGFTAAEAARHFSNFGIYKRPLSGGYFRAGTPGSADVFGPSRLRSSPELLKLGMTSPHAELRNKEVVIDFSTETRFIAQTRDGMEWGDAVLHPHLTKGNDFNEWLKDVIQVKLSDAEINDASEPFRLLMVRNVEQGKEAFMPVGIWKVIPQSRDLVVIDFSPGQWLQEGITVLQLALTPFHGAFHYSGTHYRHYPANYKVSTEMSNGHRTISIPINRPELRGAVRVLRDDMTPVALILAMDWTGTIYDREKDALIPGVKEFLEEAPERGHRVVIVTYDKEANVREKLDQFSISTGPFGTVKEILGKETDDLVSDLKTKHINALLERTDLVPRMSTEDLGRKLKLDEIAMIGDSPKDVLEGNEAQIVTIGFLGSGADEQVFLDANPHALVNDFSKPDDIFNYLGGNLDGLKPLAQDGTEAPTVKLPVEIKRALLVIAKTKLAYMGLDFEAPERLGIINKLFANNVTHDWANKIGILMSLLQTRHRYHDAQNHEKGHQGDAAILEILTHFDRVIEALIEITEQPLNSFTPSNDLRSKAKQYQVAETMIDGAVAVSEQGAFTEAYMTRLKWILTRGRDIQSRIDAVFSRHAELREGRFKDLPFALESPGYPAMVAYTDMINDGDTSEATRWRRDKHKALVLKDLERIARPAVGHMEDLDYIFRNQLVHGEGEITYEEFLHAILLTHTDKITQVERIGLIDQLRQKNAPRISIGFTGTSAGGKSSIARKIAALLQRYYPNRRVRWFSIDDFLIPRAERPKDLEGAQDTMAKYAVKDFLEFMKRLQNGDRAEKKMYDQETNGQLRIGLSESGNVTIFNGDREIEIALERNRKFSFTETWHTQDDKTGHPKDVDLTKLRGITHHKVKEADPFESGETPISIRRADNGELNIQVGDAQIVVSRRGSKVFVRNRLDAEVTQLLQESETPILEIYETPKINDDNEGDIIIAEGDLLNLAGEHFDITADVNANFMVRAVRFLKRESRQGRRGPEAAQAADRKFKDRQLGEDPTLEAWDRKAQIARGFSKGGNHVQLVGHETSEQIARDFTYDDITDQDQRLFKRYGLDLEAILEKGNQKRREALVQFIEDAINWYREQNEMPNGKKFTHPKPFPGENPLSEAEAFERYYAKGNLTLAFEAYLLLKGAWDESENLVNLKGAAKLNNSQISARLFEIFAPMEILDLETQVQDRMPTEVLLPNPDDAESWPKKEIALKFLTTLLIDQLPYVEDELSQLGDDPEELGKKWIEEFFAINEQAFRRGAVNVAPDLTQRHGIMMWHGKKSVRSIASGGWHFDKRALEEIGKAAVEENDIPLDPKYEHIPSYEKLTGFQRRFVRNGKEDDYLARIPEKYQAQYVRLASRMPENSEDLKENWYFGEDWKKADDDGTKANFKIPGVSATVAYEAMMDSIEEDIKMFFQTVAEYHLRETIGPNQKLISDSVKRPGPQSIFIETYLEWLPENRNSALFALTQAFRNLLLDNVRWLEMLKERSDLRGKKEYIIDTIMKVIEERMNTEYAMHARKAPMPREWAIRVMRSLIAKTMTLPFEWKDFEVTRTHQKNRNELRVQQEAEFAENFLLNSVAPIFNDLFQGNDDAIRARMNAEIKGDGSPVSFFDPLIEKKFRKALTEAFPNVGILGEEDETTVLKSKMWTIDPIDGTDNFLNLGHNFASMPGYWEDGHLKLALSYLPRLSLINRDPSTMMIAREDENGISVNGVRSTKAAVGKMDESNVIYLEGRSGSKTELYGALKTHFERQGFQVTRGTGDAGQILEMAIKGTARAYIHLRPPVMDAALMAFALQKIGLKTSTSANQPIFPIDFRNLEDRYRFNSVVIGTEQTHQEIMDAFRAVQATKSELRELLPEINVLEDADLGLEAVWKAILKFSDEEQEAVWSHDHKWLLHELFNRLASDFEIEGAEITEWAQHIPGTFSSDAVHALLEKTIGTDDTIKLRPTGFRFQKDMPHYVTLIGALLPDGRGSPFVEHIIQSSEKQFPPHINLSLSPTAEYYHFKVNRAISAWPMKFAYKPENSKYKVREFESKVDGFSKDNQKKIKTAVRNINSWLETRNPEETPFFELTDGFLEALPELQKTITIIEVDSPLPLLFVDLKNAVVRPANLGRSRATVYVSKGFLDHFSPEEKTDIDLLSAYLLYWMERIYILQRSAQTNESLDSVNEVLRQLTAHFSTHGWYEFALGGALRHRLSLLMKEALIQETHTVIPSIIERLAQVKNKIRKLKEDYPDVYNPEVEVRDARGLLGDIRNDLIELAMYFNLIRTGGATDRLLRESEYVASLIQKNDSGLLPMSVQRDVFFFKLRRGDVEGAQEALKTYLTGEDFIYSPDLDDDGKAAQRDALKIHALMRLDDLRKAINHAPELHASLVTDDEQRTRILQARNESLALIKSVHSELRAASLPTDASLDILQLESMVEEVGRNQYVQVENWLALKDALIEQPELVPDGFLNRLAAAIEQETSRLQKLEANGKEAPISVYMVDLSQLKKNIKFESLPGTDLTSLQQVFLKKANPTFEKLLNMRDQHEIKKLRSQLTLIKKSFIADGALDRNAREGVAQEIIDQFVYEQRFVGLKKEQDRLLGKGLLKRAKKIQRLINKLYYDNSFYSTKERLKHLLKYRSRFSVASEEVVHALGDISRVSLPGLLSPRRIFSIFTLLTIGMGSVVGAATAAQLPTIPVTTSPFDAFALSTFPSDANFTSFVGFENAGEGIFTEQTQISAEVKVDFSMVPPATDGSNKAVNLVFGTAIHLDANQDGAPDLIPAPYFVRDADRNVVTFLKFGEREFTYKYDLSAGEVAIVERDVNQNVVKTYTYEWDEASKTIGHVKRSEKKAISGKLRITLPLAEMGNDSARWNLISPPFTFNTASSFKSQLGASNVIGSMWFWTRNRFNVATDKKPMSRGLGYWVQLRDPADRILQTDQTVTSTTRALTPGWNLIGGSGPADELFDLSKTRGRIWFWQNNRFQALEGPNLILKEGFGYWVYMTESGDLFVGDALETDRLLAEPVDLPTDHTDVSDFVTATQLFNAPSDFNLFDGNLMDLTNRDGGGPINQMTVSMSSADGNIVDVQFTDLEGDSVVASGIPLTASPLNYVFDFSGDTGAFDPVRGFSGRVTIIKKGASETDTFRLNVGGGLSDFEVLTGNPLPVTIFGPNAIVTNNEEPTITAAAGTHQLSETLADGEGTYFINFVLPGDLNGTIVGQATATIDLTSPEVVKVGLVNRDTGELEPIPGVLFLPSGPDPEINITLEYAVRDDIFPLDERLRQDFTFNTTGPKSIHFTGFDLAGNEGTSKSLVIFISGPGGLTFPAGLSIESTQRKVKAINDAIEKNGGKISEPIEREIDLLRNMLLEEEGDFELPTPKASEPYLSPEPPVEVLKLPQAATEREADSNQVAKASKASILINLGIFQISNDPKNRIQLTKTSLPSGLFLLGIIALTGSAFFSNKKEERVTPSKTRRVELRTQSQNQVSMIPKSWRDFHIQSLKKKMAYFILLVGAFLSDWMVHSSAALSSLLGAGKPDTKPPVSQTTGKKAANAVAPIPVTVTNFDHFTLTTLPSTAEFASLVGTNHNSVSRVRLKEQASDGAQIGFDFSTNSDDKIDFVIRSAIRVDDDGDGVPDTVTAPYYVVDEVFNTIQFLRLPGRSITFDYDTDKGEATIVETNKTENTVKTFVYEWNSSTKALGNIKFSKKEAISGTLTDTLLLGNQWSFIGLPFPIASGSDFLNLIKANGAGVEGEIWTWDGKRLISVQPHEKMKQGFGYWLFTDASRAVAIETNQPVQAAPRRLKKGWNLISGEGPLKALLDISKITGPVQAWEGNRFVDFDTGNLILKKNVGYAIFLNDEIDFFFGELAAPELLTVDAARLPSGWVNASSVVVAKLLEDAPDEIHLYRGNLTDFSNVVSLGFALSGVNTPGTVFADFTFEDLEGDTVVAQGVPVSGDPKNYKFDFTGNLGDFNPERGLVVKAALAKGSAETGVFEIHAGGGLSKFELLAGNDLPELPFGPNAVAVNEASPTIDAALGPLTLSQTIVGGEGSYDLTFQIPGDAEETVVAQATVFVDLTAPTVTALGEVHLESDEVGTFPNVITLPSLTQPAIVTIEYSVSDNLHPSDGRHRETFTISQPGPVNLGASASDAAGNFGSTGSKIAFVILPSGSPGSVATPFPTEGPLKAGLWVQTARQILSARVDQINQAIEKNGGQISVAIQKQIDALTEIFAPRPELRMTAGEIDALLNVTAPLLENLGEKDSRHDFIHIIGTFDGVSKDATDYPNAGVTSFDLTSYDALKSVPQIAPLKKILIKLAKKVKSNLFLHIHQDVNLQDLRTVLEDIETHLTDALEANPNLFDDKRLTHTRLIVEHGLPAPSLKLGLVAEKGRALDLVIAPQTFAFRNELRTDTPRSVLRSTERPSSRKELRTAQNSHAELPSSRKELRTAQNSHAELPSSRKELRTAQNSHAELPSSHNELRTAQNSHAELPSSHNELRTAQNSHAELRMDDGDVWALLTGEQENTFTEVRPIALKLKPLYGGMGDLFSDLNFLVFPFKVVWDFVRNLFFDFARKKENALFAERLTLPNNADIATLIVNIRNQIVQLKRMYDISPQVEYGWYEVQALYELLIENSPQEFSQKLATHQKDIVASVENAKEALGFENENPYLGARRRKAAHIKNAYEELKQTIFQADFDGVLSKEDKDTIKETAVGWGVYLFRSKLRNQISALKRAYEKYEVYDDRLGWSQIREIDQMLREKSPQDFLRFLFEVEAQKLTTGFGNAINNIEAWTDNPYDHAPATRKIREIRNHLRQIVGTIVQFEAFNEPNMQPHKELHEAVFDQTEIDYIQSKVMPKLTDFIQETSSSSDLIGIEDRFRYQILHPPSRAIHLMDIHSKVSLVFIEALTELGIEAKSLKGSSLLMVDARIPTARLKEALLYFELKLKKQLEQPGLHNPDLDFKKGAVLVEEIDFNVPSPKIIDFYRDDDGRDILVEFFLTRIGSGGVAGGLTEGIFRVLTASGEVLEGWNRSFTAIPAQGIEPRDIAVTFLAHGKKYRIDFHTESQGVHSVTRRMPTVPETYQTTGPRQELREVTNKDVLFAISQQLSDAYVLISKEIRTNQSAELEAISILNEISKHLWTALLKDGLLSTSDPSNQINVNQASAHIQLISDGLALPALNRLDLTKSAKKVEIALELLAALNSDLTKLDLSQIDSTKISSTHKRLIFERKLVRDVQSRLDSGDFEKIEMPELPTIFQMVLDRAPELIQDNDALFEITSNDSYDFSSWENNLVNVARKARQTQKRFGGFKVGVGHPFTYVHFDGFDRDYAKSVKVQFDQEIVILPPASSASDTKLRTAGKLSVGQMWVLIAEENSFMALGAKAALHNEHGFNDELIQVLEPGDSLVQKIAESEHPIHIVLLDASYSDELTEIKRSGYTALFILTSASLSDKRNEAAAKITNFVWPGNAFSVVMSEQQSEELNSVIGLAQERFRPELRLDSASVESVVKVPAQSHFPDVLPKRLTDVQVKVTEQYLDYILALELVASLSRDDLKLLLADLLQDTKYVNQLADEKSESVIFKLAGQKGPVDFEQGRFGRLSQALKSSNITEFSGDVAIDFAMITRLLESNIRALYLLLKAFDQMNGTLVAVGDPKILETITETLEQFRFKKGNLVGSELVRGEFDAFVNRVASGSVLKVIGVDDPALSDQIQVTEALNEYIATKEGSIATLSNSHYLSEHLVDGTHFVLEDALQSEDLALLAVLAAFIKKVADFTSNNDLNDPLTAETLRKFVAENLPGIHSEMRGTFVINSIRALVTKFLADQVIQIAA
jgi:fructose-1,6-bisphosphatase/inositol monophosphatase family enzyme/phosphoglycolate phosphatase-like HAD superfamily hydrolase